MELVKKYDMISQIAISSFKHQYWEEIKKMDEIGNIEFGFLYDTTLGQQVDIILNGERKYSTVCMV